MDSMASRNLSSPLQKGKLPSLLGRAAAIEGIETSPKISSEIGSPFQNLEISEVNVFSSSCEDSCFGLDFLWMVFLLGLLNIAIRSSRFIPRSLKIRNGSRLNSSAKR